MTTNSQDTSVITLAGGCFWCTQAIFCRLKGMKKVIAGYAGGKIKNPTYEQVSNGNTEYAESVQIEFNPKIISLRKILEIFFATHDPTTLNQQGYDYGPQYRSVVFYHAENQKRLAKKFLKPNYVTKIVPYTTFYPAEEGHQDFYEKYQHYPYCQVVIDPKITKLLQEFKEEVK